MHPRIGTSQAASFQAAQPAADFVRGRHEPKEGAFAAKAAEGEES